VNEVTREQKSLADNLEINLTKKQLMKEAKTDY